MRRLIILATLLGTAAPALAQSPADQQRWNAAQARYQSETDRFYAERDRYYGTRRGPRGGYGAPPPPAYGDNGGVGGGYARGYDAPPGDDRYDPNYDASRYYRDGGQYQERALASDDRVYRGSDGKYYCKRNDGTTGLVIGAAGGGILGNVIDGGHSRTAGTLIGAALGALAGKAVAQSNTDIRCR